MEARRIHPDRTIIEFSPEEVQELKRAMSRIGDSFLRIPPIFKRINVELLSLNESVRGLNAGLDNGNRRPELINRHPFASPPGASVGEPGGDPVEPDEMEHGGIWPGPASIFGVKPGPGTKADWDEDRS